MADPVTRYVISVPHNEEIAVSPHLPALYSGKYVNKILNFYWIAMAKAVFSEKKTIVTSFVMWFGVGWRRSVGPIV